MTAGHRPDIDGLRAIAIGAVLAAHLGPQEWRAGVIGVDIFFVVSGYLITRMIRGGLAEGSFSLLDFYRRRAVRILPALLAMIVAVLALGMVLLLPTELAALGRSAAAAAGFAANFHFWSGAGYFDASEARPLLHSWSLGVEEQFYLVFPLLLAALHRWLPRTIPGALMLATAGSLALGWWVCLDHPAAGYYLLPARGWELGLGAVAAMWRPAPGTPPGRMAEAAAAVALAAMLGWLAFADPGSGFPTPGALPSCAAAALFLAIGAGTRAGAVLAVAPMRWLGLRSYSVYLWHWPLASLWPMLPGSGSVMAPLAVLAASLALGELSYRFVETPFRRRWRDAPRPGRIVLAGMAASAAVAAVALMISANAGRIRPLPPEAARILAYSQYRQTPAFAHQFGPVRCYGGTLRYDLEACLRFDPARRNVVVIGDSHAAHIWRAIAERFPQDNVMEAASTMCRPVIAGDGARLCRDMFERVMRGAVFAGKAQAVVLAGNWQPEDIPRIAATARAIRARGVDVTVLGPVAAYRGMFPALLARGLLRGDPDAFRARLLPEIADKDRRIAAEARAGSARYFSLFAAECPAGLCRALTRTGAPFHFDDAHLTIDGARELVRDMPRP
ncbi:acyltransferase family protein [Sphingomonas canadensis]|uniref:Acyltransferase family protein n=1 Tax=Sphingomonas canadensis TaxID=1219257 RepID=A0ABW3H6T9_9SPHN|nr:acyltransferase family protein [Sphingomonas canadensis]MCW3835096.1 acyltransferase [Sphingomonas canadensis]